MYSLLPSLKLFLLNNIYKIISRLSFLFGHYIPILVGMSFYTFPILIQIDSQWLSCQLHSPSCQTFLRYTTVLHPNTCLYILELLHTCHLPGLTHPPLYDFFQEHTFRINYRQTRLKYCHRLSAPVTIGKALSSLSVFFLSTVELLEPISHKYWEMRK